ncbi:MAG: transcription antitermination factor NusB [Planctomycetia bacterium]|nr:transcription antitermination factor NusB [Planctomycetia bacterium]
MAEVEKTGGFPTRSYARMVAFQILYQEDTNPGLVSEYADDFIYNELHQLTCGVTPDDTPALARAGEPVNDELPQTKPLSVKELTALVAFTRRLVRNVQENRDRIDEAITAVSKNWDLSRMGVAERNILRLATGEMQIGRTPKAIVIDEALELAKKFSDRESLPFINGILDRVRVKPPELGPTADSGTNLSEDETTSGTPDTDS